MYSIYTLIKQAVNSYYGRITKFKIISRNIFNNDLLVSVETDDSKQYYAIIKTIDEDNSITIIKDKLRMAIRTFNKLKRSENK